MLTIACRTRAAQALAMAKVNEWDTKKTGKHTRSDLIILLTALAYQSKAHRNGQSGQGATLWAPRKKVLKQVKREKASLAARSRHGFDAVAAPVTRGSN